MSVSAGPLWALPVGAPARQRANFRQHLRLHPKAFPAADVGGWEGLRLPAVSLSSELMTVFSNTRNEPCDCHWIQFQSNHAPEIIEKYVLLKHWLHKIRSPSWFWSFDWTSSVKSKVVMPDFPFYCPLEKIKWNKVPQWKCPDTFSSFFLCSCTKDASTRPATSSSIPCMAPATSTARCTSPSPPPWPRSWTGCPVRRLTYWRDSMMKSRHLACRGQCLSQSCVVVFLLFFFPFVFGNVL